MAVQIFVHDLGQREIRVRFDVPVASAEDVSLFTLTSSTGYVPTLVEAFYYDADRTSVRITLNYALTHGHTYSLQVAGLFSDDGVAVDTIPFSFVATDVDKPVVLGAYQSTRGRIDVLFDRPVGHYSPSATASLTGTGSPSALTLVTWSSSISPNSVRFSYSSAPTGPYSISFAGVTDISGNSTSGAVSLTTVGNPDTYAELTQAVATAAYVSDVSNARNFSTAVLRVFFNMPILSTDVLNASNWAVSQAGPHLFDDVTANLITSTDATDPASFITLVTEEVTKVSQHLVSNAHVVRGISPGISSPTDYATAVTALGLLETAVAAHYERCDLHFYADHVHTLALTGTPLARANALKSSFNSHITVNYTLDFSSAYSPVGPIVNFASSSNASFVTDEFTWAVDLHVLTDCTTADFAIRYSGLKSEDSASTASGTVYAEKVSSSSSSLCSSSVLHGVRVRTNCGVETENACLDDGITTLRPETLVSSSLGVLLWAFNNVLHAYKMHISDPSTTPYLGAGHTTLDVVNTVVSANYATSMNLASLITKANLLRTKMTAHMTSVSYHKCADVGVTLPAASDLTSLESLLREMQTRLFEHNSSGFVPSSYCSPLFPFFHDFPGVGVLSAPVGDLVTITSSCLRDGSTSSYSLPVTKVWMDNSSSPSRRTAWQNLSGSFLARDIAPALVAAEAVAGYRTTSPSPYLNADSMQLYFSKPMRDDPIVLGTSVSVSGTIVLLDASWTGEKTMSVRVTRMTSSSYSVSVSNLHDSAGNSAT